MYHPMVYVLLLPLFPLEVIARPLNLTFNTSGLEIATNAVVAFFAVVTYIQFLIVVTYLCRGRSPHMAPGGVAALALLVLALSYSFEFVQQLFTYDLDESSFSDLIRGLIRGFLAGDRLCQGWADAAMILTTSLIILDRYSTHNEYVPVSARKSPLPLHFIMPALYFLTVLVFMFSSASAGVLASMQDVFIDGQLAANLSGSQANASNSLLYTATAMYIVATIVLVPFAIMAKRRTTSDKVMSWTAYVIVPLLFLKGIAQIVLFSKASTVDTTSSSGGRPSIDLATIIANGTLYFFVGCAFCHIFLRPRLWGRFAECPSKIYSMPAQQFPGQWGYPKKGDYNPEDAQHYPFNGHENRDLPNQKPAQEIPKLEQQQHDNTSFKEPTAVDNFDPYGHDDVVATPVAGPSTMPTSKKSARE